MEDISKKWLILGGILATLLVGSCTFRVNFLTFVDSYELGYEFDKTTGKIKVLEHTGWAFVKPFFTEVHTVDLRPMQVKIEFNNRVLNAKLVQFKKEGLLQFLDLHGRADYDQEKLGPILSSYAYEGSGTAAYSIEHLQNKYTFLIIKGGTSTNDGINSIDDGQK